MENKGNKNPQSNQTPSAQGSSNAVQSSSNTNTSASNVGSSSQSSASGISGSQSSRQGSQSSGMGGTFSKENLNNLTSKLQQFGSSTVEKVNGLSTTQKVVGGSLLALGAGWVAMNSMNKNKPGSIGSKIANAQDKLAKNLNKNKNR